MNDTKWQQVLHIEPPDGWLNDPNGLCFFNGEYHVFFQYSPKSAQGKTPRCWGHYAGKTLITLAYKGIALSPTLHEEKHGVYSGSAVVHDDTLHLFYSGNVKEDGDYDYIYEGRGAAVLHVTSKNGYTMGKKQVVLRNADYPVFCSCHVRDPKVWEQDGVWYMVLGARTRNDEGCVLFYRSRNLSDWEYVSAAGCQHFGYMWECPDYFTLKDHAYLSVSPQGLTHEPTRFQNLYQSGYFRADGLLPKLNDLSETDTDASKNASVPADMRVSKNESMDADMLPSENVSVLADMPASKCNSVLHDFTEWDMGFDFYAPQTFTAPDGRRILIGWMGMDTDSYENATVPLGYQHCLTLPREITATDDGTLLQNPLSELKAMRKKELYLKENSCADISLPFDLCAQPQQDFLIKLTDGLELSFSAKNSMLFMRFTDEAIGCGRTVRNVPLSHCDTIRIIADRSSVEVFANDGAVVMSTRFYPQKNTIPVSILGMDARIHEL